MARQPLDDRENLSAQELRRIATMCIEKRIAKGTSVNLLPVIEVINNPERIADDRKIRSTERGLRYGEFKSKIKQKEND